MAKLNAKQERFCQEYIVDLNAAQAAIRAGYSAKTARSIGQENLTKPDIARRISELQCSYQEKTEITVEKVIREIAKGAFASLDVSEMKYADKLKCLELLSKHLGMLDGSGVGKDNNGDVTGRLLRALQGFSK